MRRAAALFLALLCISAPLSAHAETVTVFAAISLNGSLDSVAKQYEAATGNRVVISFAASSALARQIENGAPADVFISADTEWADYLIGKRRLRADTRTIVLTNELVLVAPKASKLQLTIAPGFPLAAALDRERLVLSQEAVPVGKYAKAALESLGVWAGVQNQVARAENARAAVLMVSRGNAPLGIVYRTDALADSGVRIVDTFPASSHPPILYAAGLISGRVSPAASEFLAYLRGATARAIWEQHGFKVP